MGRIRTIKPEFPQSESVGKLSRDARLLFIQLWTIADDEGRCRAASRMLASLLYPYDDDVSRLIDGWLDELEKNGQVRRYEVDGSTYLEIVKWLDHQKIDRPSKSKMPAFAGSPRALATISEVSETDLGPRKRTKDSLGRSLTRPDRLRGNNSRNFGRRIHPGPVRIRANLPSGSSVLWSRQASILNS
jgi:hypothetical protein